VPLPQGVGDRIFVAYTDGRQISMTQVDFNSSAPLPVTAAAAPTDAALKMIRADQVYLDFGYYGWGPEWSGVARTSETVEGDKSVRFTSKNTLQKVQANFTVEGSSSPPQW